MQQEKAGFRHGDVMLLPAMLTDDMRRAFNQVNSNINGKVIIVHHNDVGHDHVLHAPQAGKATIDGTDYFDIGAGAYLDHPEHGRLDIAPGIYEKRMEQEYSPLEEAMRQVID